MSKEVKKNDTKVSGTDTNIPLTSETAATTEIQTNLGLDDIAILIKLVEITSEKGLFKPADFLSIGTTYQKLVQIVRSVEPAK